MKNHNKQGSSLIETLAALAVSVVVVMGLVVAVNLSLKASRINRVRSYATKLSQDGIEFVRNERDANWSTFANTDYLAGSKFCLKFDNIKFSTLAITNCTFASDPAITGFTQNFRRMISVTAADANSRTIVVETQWEDGSTWRSSNAQTILTNWE